MDNKPEFPFILQVHRDDRFWFERPCRTEEEISRTIERITDKIDADQIWKIWFRVYEFKQNITEW